MRNISILILLFLGCNSSDTNKSEKSEGTPQLAEFNPQNYIISKGSLGDIKVGQTISEAEKLFKGLTKKVEDAESFGICGGGKINIYYKDTILVFALLPYDGTDTILNIIAVEKNLKTTNGLNANSTVEEIYKKYPEMKVGVSMTTDEESFYDKENGWQYTFLTTEENRVGKYVGNGEEENVKPYNLKIKCDYIIIDKSNK